MGNSFSLPDWRTHFDRGAMYGNSVSSRILVLSGQAETDKDYVKQKVETDQKMNKAWFKVMDVSEIKLSSESEREQFVKSVKGEKPTNIVLAYPHQVDTSNINNYLEQADRTKFRPLELKPDTIPKVLVVNGLVDEFLDCFSETILVLSTLNMFRIEQSCMMMSATKSTGKGAVKTLIEEVVEEKKIENKEEVRIAIISGGHGYNNKSVVAKSCFTNVKLMDHENYEDDCVLVGVEAEPDPCKYNSKHEVNGINPRRKPNTKPEPLERIEPAQLTDGTEPLMWDERFDKMKFNVVHVAQFYQDADALVEHLRQYDPTFLIINWCFASNGDLALALRARGFYSKMLLNYEMRILLKNKDVQLRDDQVEVMRQSIKDHIKHVVFSGPSGCGKTFIAAEVTKTKVARKTENKENKEEVEVKVMVLVNGSKEPNRLLEKLKEDYFQGMEPFLTDDSFIKLGEWGKNINSVDDLKSLLISKVDPTKTSIIFLDEVTVSADNPTFSNLCSDLPPNLHLVCCLSPTQGKFSEQLYNPDQLGLPTQADVYCPTLRTCYRNNTDIQKFIQFYASEMLGGVHYVLSDKTHSGPDPLPGSSHPVVWLHYKGYVSRSILDTILDTMVGSVKTYWGDCTVLGIRTVGGDNNGSHYTAGVEADIIVLGDDYDTSTYSYEAVSRARRQLYYLTDTDTVQSTVSVLKRAVREGLVERREVTWAHLERGEWVDMVGERGEDGTDTEGDMAGDRGEGGTVTDSDTDQEVEMAGVRGEGRWGRRWNTAKKFVSGMFRK